ncbi:MAG: hypothetical protein J6A28_00485 [Clostridia bacterium]|nr:hypothetical protein [Clostridia bacterium]
MNKKLSLENKIKNSNFQITKNFLYYAIAPVVVLLVGIILLCTVGFNASTEFTGGSTFSVYVNNGGEYSQSTTYDIDKDYNLLCGKIADVLNEENCVVESFHKTQIDIEGVVAGGDAIKVVFKNSSENVEGQNQAIKDRVLSAIYGDSSNEDAMTDVSSFKGTISLGWTIALVGAVIFAIALASIYLAFRGRSPMWLIAVVQGVIDIMVTAGLILICRIPVGTGVAAVIASCGFVSLVNCFCFLSRAKHNIANGLYDKITKSRMADTTTKELAFKKGIIAAVCAIIVILLTIVPVSGIRYAALSALVMLITTFYTTHFITPALWTATYKTTKKIK